MKKPRTPPDAAEIISKGNGSFLSPDVLEYAEKFNREYLHWDDLRYRETGKVPKEDIWAAMKLLRVGSRKVKLPGLTMSFNLPWDLQEILHEIDVMRPPEMQDPKRLSALATFSMMEESIASSQTEGAETPTEDALRMLREGRRPRNASERMIADNYRAMRLVKERLGEKLTPGLIEETHSAVTEGTPGEGSFREDDSVVVADALTRDTAHVPVPHGDIGGMIDALCGFANDDTAYVHPIVKGIILHYALAYIHPFADGNGRTARALFRWYILKKGYRAMEFVPISASVRDRRGRYDRAFLLSESDGNDITYFVDYNLKMIQESAGKIGEYTARADDERKRVMTDLSGTGINSRQTEIAAGLKRSGGSASVYGIATEYGVSVNTARNDVRKLVEKGLLVRAGKDSSRVLYAYAKNNLSRN